MQPAYMLGNARFTAGALKGVFDDRREMTDAIKKAVEGSAIEGSPCEKLKAD